jgi:hypothetical protein
VTVEDRVARPAPPPHRSASRRLLARRAIVFAGAAVLLSVLALNGGGYDLVVRQKVALAVWASVALGLGLGLLPRSRLDRSVLLIAAAAGALVVWTVLALAWTGSDERTLAEVARLLGYLGIVFLAILGLNRRTFRAAAAGLSAVAIGVAALALASRLFPSASPDATAVARFFRADRLDYPLDYWNAVGAWGAIAVAIGLAWSAHARHVLTRAICLAAVPVAATAVYLTYSRGGVAGAAVAVVAVLALSRNRWTALAQTLVAGGCTAIAILTIRDNPEIADAAGGAGGAEVALILLLGAVICAATATATASLGLDRLRLPQAASPWARPLLAAALTIAALIAVAGPVSTAWDEFSTEEQVVTSADDPAARLASAGGNRKDLWDSAIAAFRAEPLTGIGPGTYEFWWSRDARDPEYVRDAHSLYLEHLAELGLPGLLMLLALLGALAAGALRARAGLTSPGNAGASVAMTAAFAVFLVNAGVDWAWEETALAALGLGAGAIAVAGGLSRPRGRGAASAMPRPLRAGLVALAITAAAVQVPALVGEERIRASREAAREGDLARSRALAEDALDAAPWAASPHEQLALVAEAEGQFPKARRQVREAIGKEPDNWRYPLLLSRILAAEGRREQARAVFARGRRLRPRSPSYSPFSPFGRPLYGDAELRRIVASGRLTP